MVSPVRASESVSESSPVAPLLAGRTPLPRRSLARILFACDDDAPPHRRRIDADIDADVDIVAVLHVFIVIAR